MKICITCLYIEIFSILVLADSTSCAFNITGSSGFITSHSVGNHKKCTWLITTARDHKIKLQFTTFQWYSFWSTQQNEIHVYDGKTVNATLVGVYAGTRRPFIVQSSGRFMLITLTLHSSGDVAKFEAVYNSTTEIGRPQSFILTDVS